MYDLFLNFSLEVPQCFLEVPRCFLEVLFTITLFASSGYILHSISQTEAKLPSYFVGVVVSTIVCWVNWVFLTGVHFGQQFHNFNP